jgi:nucleotide-binding universal stress UspA family protein
MTEQAMRILLASDDSIPARAAEAWVTNARWAQPPRVSILSIAAPTIAAAAWLNHVGREGLRHAIQGFDQVEEKQARHLAAEVAERMNGAGLEATARARRGEVALEILKEINEARPDLVALGPRGRSEFTAALLGSVTQQVLSHSGVPVLVARSERVPSGRLPQVLVLLADGTLSIMDAIDWLARAGWLRDTRAIVAGLLGVSPGLKLPRSDLAEDITAELRLAAKDVLHSLSELIRPHTRDVTVELHFGHPLQTAREVVDRHLADLLVVARRPPQPGDYPFADKVARYSSTSVLLVPARAAPATMPAPDGER